MTIIDVRTTQEFVSGNVEGSLNIPLQELMNHIEEIKTLPEPIIFVVQAASAVSKLQIILNLLV